MNNATDHQAFASCCTSHNYTSTFVTPTTPNLVEAPQAISPDNIVWTLVDTTVCDIPITPTFNGSYDENRALFEGCPGFDSFNETMFCTDAKFLLHSGAVPKWGRVERACVAAALFAQAVLTFAM